MKLSSKGDIMKQLASRCVWIQT